MVYEAMALSVDDAVGEIVSALRQGNLWSRSLLIFASDNGAPLGHHGSNAPLRFGKDSFFEGGVRTVAALGGGVLPESLRGQRSSSYMHESDWYASLCHLAGVSSRERSSKVPPVDSKNMWPLWMSRRSQLLPARTIALSSHAILRIDRRGAFKLINGSACRSKQANYSAHCRVCASLGGCVYDVAADPYEERNLALVRPSLMAELQEELQAAQASRWQDDDPRNRECGTSVSKAFKLSVSQSVSASNNYLAFAARHGATIQPYQFLGSR